MRALRRVCVHLVAHAHEEHPSVADPDLTWLILGEIRQVHRFAIHFVPSLASPLAR
jgi:hypothetical protein